MEVILLMQFHMEHGCVDDVQQGRLEMSPPSGKRATFSSTLELTQKIRVNISFIKHN